ncbi:aminopeptidase N [Actinotalea sp. M2MS4P-6]|uniref:aminopeptidase N n=1 Tax=Actinotalea sp. M2MS4P-6 TaxID=2983762 RepID=UPI0021E39F2F|nr:aminopeptidase N [Actinotalea sp. M2MS4P-6]MCV2396241.1 aminopeptidase N [Actinotalea sp. M2MS4P-6]
MPGQNLTRDEARTRAVLSVSSYGVDLDLTTGPTTFRSTTVVRFGAPEGFSTFIDLIAPAVHEVVLNGRSLDPAAVFADSRIALDGLTAENELRVVADCAYMNTGEGLHRFVDPVDDEVYLYSQFEVADSRRVFAVFEQPDLKSTFAFTVTAPEHWTVVSNSPTPEPEPAADGSARWVFEPTPRLSSYVTAIVAGPYHRDPGTVTSTDGRVLGADVLCRRSLAEHLDADEIRAVTQAGFEFYESRFAMAYPFAKYDQIFVPEFNAGAMENAGAVTFLENYVFRSKVPEATVERRAVTILHELAHMWFGDLVTMRWWDDLWLNESFAEYVSHLATAEVTRWSAAWTTFASLEKSWAYRQDQLPSTHPIVADIHDLEDVEVNFDGITYAKGASVLKQLVAWVGEKEFFAGVQAYFARHAWGNTELHDLLTELEATSGRDLSSWSRLWLEEAGVTLLRPVVDVDAHGVVTHAEIVQQIPDAHPVQRPHRLVVAAYDLVPDGDGSRFARTSRAELDVDGPRTPVPDLVGRARPDLVLVNDEDLAYAKVRLDDASFATATEHLRDFADSLPRTLIWGAAWDMTRDAEVPARSFVDLVLANVADESDSSVVQVLLRQLATTIDLYVARAARAETSQAAADTLWCLAVEAAPDSDTQLQLVRSFAARATTAAHLDAVQGLLDGSAPLEGLGIDTDLRWELLSALVAGGRAGEAEIAAQLAADRTATGARAAAAARAAVPTAQAKAAAFEAAVHDTALANALQTSTIAGFGRAHDLGLLAPLVEPYFDALVDVWHERTNETAQNVVLGLFPTRLAGSEVDVLALTDAWLAAHQDAPPALLRLVKESRDGVHRALVAQARDEG